ncbi:aldehyde dehydrogenase family protein [Variovorax defluvii]
MHDKHLIFIDGRWQAPASAGAIDIVNPYTEARIGRVPACGAEEADAAVQAARAAFPLWSGMPAAERGALLAELHRRLAARGPEIAALITSETGMPVRMSQRLQLGLPLTTLELTVRMLQDFAFERRVGHSLVVREAIGVVACITPWNYPLHQAMSKVAPALAAGCTVVLKPSEIAPLSAFVLAEEIEAAGFPPGVFNLITGTGAAVGEPLVAHAEVDMVSFTGSTAAGRRISEIAARTVKRVALELGGKSASVILDDADLPAAVKTTVNVCFLNAGQTCTALTRMLVPRSRHDEACELAAGVARAFTPGDPMDEKSRLGPLTTATQRDRVTDYIRRGEASGARLVAGGAGRPAERGFFVQPTIFGAVDPASAIAQEEIFGPVLCIIPYDSEDEAVQIANGTIYGLAAAVWGDEARARAVGRRLRAGQVDINGGSYNPSAPFGGYKQSGNGRELGVEGLEEFMEVKAMQLRDTAMPA